MKTTFAVFAAVLLTPPVKGSKHTVYEGGTHLPTVGRHQVKKTEVQMKHTLPPIAALLLSPLAASSRSTNTKPD